MPSCAESWRVCGVSDRAHGAGCALRHCPSVDASSTKHSAPFGVSRVQGSMRCPLLAYNIVLPAASDVPLSTE
jgi:hypothetical protein